MSLLARLIAAVAIWRRVVRHPRDDRGLPGDWVARVKRSLMTCGPGFAAQRMVGDYVERMYAQVADAAVR